MKTSTTFVSAAKSYPQTSSSNCARDNTAVLCSASTASRSNSRLVRSTSMPLTRARRPGMSTSSAPTVMVSEEEVAVAQQCLHPGHQLGQHERFDQVIVGAGLQTRDSVVDRTTRAEHADRDVV